MSKIIASAAIRGAHKLVGQAEESVKKALEAHGPDKVVEFPNTGYFLPVTYGMSGIKVTNVGELSQVVDKAKSLLPPIPDENVWLPYLGHALDAGMAALFADEVIEVVKYLQDPVPYTMAVNVNGEGLWLGAANDIIMRERGVEFVDGSAPGFAACVGAPEDPKVAVKIAQELQEKNLYVFMSCDSNGRSMAEQLKEAGVQLGWDTRLVPFGKDVTATVFALGFATRAAMAFGGVQPGDFARNLKYNKNRIFAFVLAFGEVSDEKYAQAAGAINYGFPVISDHDIPQVLPTGICTYEHVVSQIPHDKMVQKAVEVRGLKIKITKIPIPVAFGPAFEGERIRREDTHVEIRGDKKPAFEWLTTLDAEKVEDGKIEMIGDDLDKLKLDGANTIVPYGMVIEVAGRQMEPDFEPIIERKLHDMVNYASGAFHMGQRDQVRLRLSNQAVEKGLKLEHLGKIVHAKIHDEFSSIVDKVQVKIITDEKAAEEWREKARKVYHHRDDRIKGLTDEAVDTFYSCLLCQSFAPTHVCVVTPERPGLCGAVNWLDGKAGYQIDPSGGHQPIPKGNTVDAKVGQWDKANEFVQQSSRGVIERMSAYSMIVDPMTSCGCFECIACILPMTNGIMIVDRDFPDMTPCGMKFSTLAGTVGGGAQTPGFIGHSKLYINSKKFISADGGIKRIVWMPKQLKEELGEKFKQRAAEEGVADLLDKIADETVATTEEEVLKYITEKGHPAISMDPML